MGSIGNKNPWRPSENYIDCSQGICSINCPQWCSYIFFPPPPPLEPYDDSSTTFSPLIIAIIGLLASGFLLLSYYIIIAKYCRRRRHRNSTTEIEANHDEIRHDDQLIVASTGLDETIIKSITICKYKKGDGLIEATECAVCLNEFQENENLRLLPQCTHAFHLPCIDTWLKTHPNCPLCRSTAAPTSPPPPAPPPPPPPPPPQTSMTLTVSSLQVQRQNDLVFVERNINRDEVIISLVTGEFLKDPELKNNVDEIDQEGVKNFRRSISLGTFSCQSNLSIADILKIDEDEDIEGEVSGSRIIIASSNISSRDFESTRIHDKGKNSIIPD